ncbi:MAG: hypothetical protein IPN96_07185 [Anaerolineales bacterium]|nr:hypothetical protein [Anaerolineales bacterium]
MLDEIAREITEEKEFQITITVDSINASIARIQVEIQTIEQKREVALQALREESTQKSIIKQHILGFRELKQPVGRFTSKKEIDHSTIIKIETRINEIKNYQISLLDELTRMERTKDAGNVLSVLKITNCPACDQSVKTNNNSDHCYLCGQVTEKAITKRKIIKRIEDELRGSKKI